MTNTVFYQVKFMNTATLIMYVSMTYKGLHPGLKLRVRVKPRITRIEYRGLTRAYMSNTRSEEYNTVFYSANLRSLLSAGLGLTLNPNPNPPF